METGLIREDFDTVISIHARRRMSLRAIANEWNTRLKGKKRWEVDGGKFSTAPGVYRNMNDDYPATARKANRQFGEEGFTLTPRHLARIQGVPDEFKIWVDVNKLGYCINKGRTVVTKTPPYEISVWFKKCLIKALKHI
jgi:site-specific DNA-cytosine methylase